MKNYKLWTQSSELIKTCVCVYLFFSKQVGDIVQITKPEGIYSTISDHSQYYFIRVGFWC